MSFCVRLMLVAAVAVALVVMLASAVVYVVVRDQLRAEVDEGFCSCFGEIARILLEVVPSSGGEFFLRIPGPRFGGAAGYVQVVDTDGKTIRFSEAIVPIPVENQAREVAAGNAGSFFYDTCVSGTHVRVFIFFGADGYAIQVARPLSEVDDVFARIRTFLIVIALVGIAVAVGLGLLVFCAAVAPVTRLTEVAERVIKIGDLSERIDAGGQDELSRLAGSFNRMLGALEESAWVQRQLVADASYELRTFLTSLCTNFEVLMSERELFFDECRRLLDDVVEQIAEMTMLIAGLIEFVRGGEHLIEPEDVRLDLLTVDVVERVCCDRSGVTFVVELEESMVRGVLASLERAIGNLFDNAVKWSPAGGEVEVAVESGSVIVRDHGLGIVEEDLSFVFDCFYCSRLVRKLSGFGLGLVIVRQTAEAHGGIVIAE